MASAAPGVGSGSCVTTAERGGATTVVIVVIVVVVAGAGVAAGAGCTFFACGRGATGIETTGGTAGGAAAHTAETARTVAAEHREAGCASDLIGMGLHVCPVRPAGQILGGGVAN